MTGSNLLCPAETHSFYGTLCLCFWGDKSSVELFVFVTGLIKRSAQVFT